MTGIISTESQFGGVELLRGNDQELREAVRAVVSRNAFARNLRSVTAAEDIDPRYSIYLLDSTSAAFALTLPPANYWGSSKGGILSFIHTAGSNAVTIQPNGGTLDTIDVGATITSRVGDRFDLVSDGSSAWYWFFNGLSVMNGQLVFPATQNSSANANTLDDYEEGTWTPSPKFGGNATGLTLGVQSGTYTKIGRVLAFEFRIQFSAKGSSTGSMTIEGLPYGRSAGNGAWTTGYINSFAVALHNIVGDVVGTTLSVFKTVAGVTSVVTDADTTNGTDIIGFGQIFTA